MQNNLKEDMKLIQGLTYEAYISSGQIMALLDQKDQPPDKLRLIIMAGYISS